MKRVLSVLITVLALAISASAQGIAFIQTDSVLAAIPQYKEVQSVLKLQADRYRAELEADLNQIKDLYNSYQSGKRFLSSSAQSSAENQIITLENALKSKQEQYFGAGGEMDKATATLLDPIREKVNAVIKAYAVEKGYTAVFDIKTSPQIIYYDNGSDITGAVIERLKQL